MKLSLPLKALGIFLVLIEGACAAFLISTPPILATLGAMDAKAPEDWFFVGVVAFGLPCIRGIRDVAEAFLKDFRELRELW